MSNATTSVPWPLRDERLRRNLLTPLTPLALLVALAAGPVAAQSVVVVVAASSKAPAKVPTDEVSAIFMGTAKAFGNGERAIPIDQKAGSEAYAAFYQKAAGKTESQMKAYWSRITFTGKGQPPQDGGDSPSVKKLVAANPNMVGYIDAGQVDGSVRVIADLK